jgi:hypothetical protein
MLNIGTGDALISACERGRALARDGSRRLGGSRVPYSASPYPEDRKLPGATLDGICRKKV